MRINKWVGVVCAAISFSCSAAEEGASDGDVAQVSGALWEDSCTTIASPPSGTTNNSIGSYSYDYGNCSPTAVTSTTFWSPSYTYNPSACPRQYVVELTNPNPPPSGLTKWFYVEPVWGGPFLDNTNCGQARLSMSVWKWIGYFVPHWEFPAVDQFTATGSWESGACVFRRDDNGSSNLKVLVEENMYETSMRVAIQAKRGSNHHSVGVTASYICIQ
jgi:hypothetical protein